MTYKPKPVWTVRRISDALQAFALVHQHALVEAIVIKNDTLSLMIYETADGDHQWWSIDTAGQTKLLP